MPVGGQVKRGNKEAGVPAAKNKTLEQAPAKKSGVEPPHSKAQSCALRYKIASEPMNLATSDNSRVREYAGSESRKTWP